MKKLNGIHLSHDKGTKDCATIDFPLPKSVVIPMSQHMGAPCKERRQCNCGTEDR